MGKILNFGNSKHGNIDQAAHEVFPALLIRWLPGGYVVGDEYITLNPTREDMHIGSFKINLKTDKWADFATTDSGKGAVSLAAYLFDISKNNAAKQLAAMLNMKGQSNE